MKRAVCITVGLDFGGVQYLWNKVCTTSQSTALVTGRGEREDKGRGREAEGEGKTWRTSLAQSR